MRCGSGRDDAGSVTVFASPTRSTFVTRVTRVMSCADTFEGSGVTSSVDTFRAFAGDSDTALVKVDVSFCTLRTVLSGIAAIASADSSLTCTQWNARRDSWATSATVFETKISCLSATVKRSFGIFVDILVVDITSIALFSSISHLAEAVAAVKFTIVVALGVDHCVQVGGNQTNTLSFLIGEDLRFQIQSVSLLGSESFRRESKEPTSSGLACGGDGVGRNGPRGIVSGHQVEGLSDRASVTLVEVFPLGIDTG